MRDGRLSIPVLAILTFATLVIVGSSILTYFYVIAPQATRQSSLQVIGEPILYKMHYYIDRYGLSVTFKNVGTAPVKILYAEIIVEGEAFSCHKALSREKYKLPKIISPGESLNVIFLWNASGAHAITPLEEDETYTIIVVTDFGQIELMAEYRG